MRQMKKPNQIIDEITGVIYPPAEAVVNQLSTIKAIIPSTIKMYQDTQDIHTIFPNLQMIQGALDYLRGMPMLDGLKPLPDDKIKPTIIAYSSDVKITVDRVGDKEYNVELSGVDIEPHIQYPDLFGELDIDVLTASIGIPVICGRRYEVTQINPILRFFKDDPTISEMENGDWVKNKEYLMEEDDFEYSFLVPDGRNHIEIIIKDLDAESSDEAEPIVFKIATHIHFAEPEEDTVE